MVGIDVEMRQYNSWYTRGRPVTDVIGVDGRPMPDLHVAQPPVASVEEDA